MSSKSISLLWILLAYFACCTVGYAYLANTDGNLLLRSFIADIIATLVIFIFSRAFKNSSFYDAYWSVIPPLFLLYWLYSRAFDGEPYRYISSFRNAASRDGSAVKNVN